MGEWRERQVTEHWIVGVSKGWTCARVQDSMKTPSKHSERKKKVGGKVQEERWMILKKNFTDVEILCMASPTSWKLGESPTQYPYPLNSIIRLILLKYYFSMIYSKLLVHLHTDVF